MKKELTGSWIEGLVAFLVIIAFLLLIILGGTGWIKNMIKLTQCDFKPPYKAEIVHGIGILPPVGAITGWTNPGK